MDLERDFEIEGEPDGVGVGLGVAVWEPDLLGDWLLVQVSVFVRDHRV